MKLHLRKILSLAILLLYLVGGALVDLTHHDATGISLSSQPVLDNHGCGAKERHIPLESSRQCLACTFYAQRIAGSVVQSFDFQTSVVCFGSFSYDEEQPLQTDILYSGKRGPPQA